MTKKYDLIIIGGGAAAFAAANTANRLGKRTLMINDSKILPLGGTCVNVGCVPSKIMLRQGQEYFRAVNSPFRAIQLKGKVDFIEVLKETREMVKFYQEKNYGKVIARQENVEFKEGRAKFVSANEVEVNGERFYGEKILIATGASTFVPGVEGIDEVDYLTNVSVFNKLDEKPESVVIFGGGAIAMEFSQIFNHFGIKVIVLQRSERVLSRFDSFIGEEIRKYLEEESVEIHTGVSVKRVRNKGKGVELDVEIKGEGARKISGEKLMLAVGLQAHTKDIDAEKAGVELTERGFVKTNEYLQTSQENIYAAGDVTELKPLETVAAKHGNIAVLNMFKGEKKKINYDEIPSAVFTSPEVASVGIGEEEYMRRYKTCLCRTISIEHVEKAGAIKDTSGKIRMVLNHETREIVGVHIVAPLAADVITTAVYAIRNKMTPEDVRDVVH
ncbi:FAD-dependent oxidoreductase, partial [Candidatus Pacearchaeota archaeon]